MPGKLPPADARNAEGAPAYLLPPKHRLAQYAATGCLNDTFYADAGNSLRNPKQWADEQRDHESQMKEKQAALDTAKQKFADLQEQGRRVGLVIE